MTTDQRLFDASAACALWNAGERKDLELKPTPVSGTILQPNHKFLILQHPAYYGSTHRIITVKLNPDDTIEPAPETWGS